MIGRNDSQDLAHQAPRASLAGRGRAIVAVDRMPFTTFQTRPSSGAANRCWRTSESPLAGATGGDAVSLEPDGHLVACGRHEGLPEVVRVADHLLRIAVGHNTAEIIFSIVVNPVRLNESYGVYTLSQSNRNQRKLLDRIELDHTC